MSLEYESVLKILQEVPPFKPWYWNQSTVGRLPVFLHLLASACVIRPLAPLMYLQYRLVFKKFIVDGLENLPKHEDGPIIFVANHSSYLDPPIIGFALHRHYGHIPWFMAKKKLWERWHYRLCFSMLGALPYVRRAVNPEEHLNQLRAFVSVLKAGQPLIIFPEGTIPGEVEFGRNGFCKLRSHIQAQTGLLKTGALVPLLALAAQARVVPIGISGTGRVLPPEIHPGAIWPRRSKKKYDVRIKFGPSIDVKKELEILHPKISEEALSNYANERLMLQISRLVDFDLQELPYHPPLSQKDFSAIRDFESRVADQYRAKGKLQHAQKVMQSLTEV